MAAAIVSPRPQQTPSTQSVLSKQKQVPKLFFLVPFPPATAEELVVSLPDGHWAQGLGRPDESSSGGQVYTPGPDLRLQHQPGGCRRAPQEAVW